MSYVFFACGIVMFLFAVMQLLSAGKQPLHYYMSIASFALAFELLYFWAAETGMLERLPWLIGSSIPAVLVAAPAFYLASLSVLRGGARSERPAIAYFAGPLLLVFGFSAYRIAAGPAVPPARAGIVGYFEYYPLFTITMAVFVATVACSIKSAYDLKRAGKIRKGVAFKTQIVFLHIYMLEAILILIACALASDRVLALSVAAFGCTAAGFTLTCTGIVYISRKSPFAPSREALTKRARDGSAERLYARVEKLMEESAPYMDPELTIDKLARMLKVEPKELSRFFNAGLRTTFRGYINERRLGAACKGLIEKPESTILETAFENGFNSKTSFNTLFAKAYGMSPREYRAAKAAARGGTGTSR